MAPAPFTIQVPGCDSPDPVPARTSDTSACVQPHVHPHSSGSTAGTQSWLYFSPNQAQFSPCPPRPGRQTSPAPRAVPALLLPQFSPILVGLEQLPPTALLEQARSTCTHGEAGNEREHISAPLTSGGELMISNWFVVVGFDYNFFFKIWLLSVITVILHNWGEI